MMYEFNPDDVERFTHSIGAKAKRSNGQIVFKYCPYCHGGGKDKDTFYISLSTGQFECKRSSCGVKGNMITLARDFSDSFELTRDVTRYYNVGNFNGSFRKFKSDHIESKDAAVEYMASRGIAERTCKAYEITSKTTDSGEVIVFPFRDEVCELKFIKYRNPSHKKGDPGSKEWCESKCMPILFGMNRCEDRGTLVITEGQIDSLSLSEAGIKNAVSVPTGANGFTWVPHCWDFLQQFERIIVFGDFEKGKITLYDELKRRMPKKVFCVKPENYRGCKDANEILMTHGIESLVHAVSDIEPHKLTNIIKVSQIQRVDIEKIPAISTGFTEVDRLLSGGIHFSQLAILTGKRGDGKSTLGSELIIEAVKQNFPVFAYSGELPGFFFKNWLDRQIAGKSDIHQSELDEIERWYDDKLYFFSREDTDVEDEADEAVMLLAAIEDAVTRLSCKFIFIDNLMTAIDSSSDRIYGMQSKFVGDLVKIAKRHDVAILLVAHPRKSNGFVSDENDMVSGSSNITDRADIVLRYARPDYRKGEEPLNASDVPDRHLHITKNRLTGKLTGSVPVALWYDDKSKRISDRKGCFDKVYVTEDNDGFEDYTEEEFPFE